MGRHDFFLEIQARNGLKRAAASTAATASDSATTEATTLLPAAALAGCTGYEVEGRDLADVRESRRGSDPDITTIRRYHTRYAKIGSRWDGGDHRPVTDRAASRKTEAVGRD